MTLLFPVLIAILAWWVGTGVVLYLQQRIRPVRKPLIISLGLMASISLLAMVIGAQGIDIWQSYLGFFAAITLWGSIELSYYTGLIGGVHKRACPAGCDTGKRFRLALGASIWHELSVLFAGGVVMTLLHNADNLTGLYTFLVLWLMRWSAKLNLFFGVPNFNTDWFPKRLAYAHSYIRRAPVSWFFPVSVLLACFFAAKMITTGLASPEVQSLVFILPGVLLSLAIVEHLFMALPIADSELWNRIFAHEENPANNSKIPCADNNEINLSSTRIQERTQKRIHQVVTSSTNPKISATLTSIEATVTPSVSQ